MSTIFICLLASGLIRIGTTGFAIANADTDLAKRYLSDEDFERDTTEISKLMLELKERGDALDAREEAVAQREELVGQSKREIEQELRKLELAEQSLLETVARVESASEKDVANLTTVYETMKPKDAALLFQEMNSEFAAGFLSQMSATAAAGILSGLTSEKAYEISVVLAGRNSEAGK